MQDARALQSILEHTDRQVDRMHSDSQQEQPSIKKHERDEIIKPEMVQTYAMPDKQILI